MPSRRIDNFPESRRGLGRHLNFTIFGSTVGYPSDSLASCTIGLRGPCPPFEQRTISHMAKTYDIREVAPMEITKIVATRLQILTLKCTKFDFGWGSAPDPAGGA